MAGTTGLEPATSAVTGQRSNQLSYVPRRVVETDEDEVSSPRWTSGLIRHNDKVSLSDECVGLEVIGQVLGAVNHEGNWSQKPFAGNRDCTVAVRVKGGGDPPSPCFHFWLSRGMECGVYG